MTFNLKASHALLAASLIALPGAALAQDKAVDKQAKVVASEAKQLQQATGKLDNAVANANANNAVVNDDANNNAAAANYDANDGDHDGYRHDHHGHGNWGLLGLLGLAGLLGLRRRDDRDRVYATTDRRDYDDGRVAGTTTTRGRTTTTDPDTRL